MATTAPPLVILLDYRTILETVDLDAANEESWREALNGFGYQNLDFSTFLQDLALSSSSEVMMALCPYTTKDEWGPALSKRDERLAVAVEEMCYANLVPVPGVIELIATASKLRRTTTMVLSPFREDITRSMLTTSGLSTIVDCVVCYSSLDTAVLEALAAVKCAPPMIPSRFAHAAADFASADSAFAGADVVAFVSTSTAAKKMRGFGVSLVGIMHNNCDQEEDLADEDNVVPLAGRDSTDSLAESGCELAVINFKKITPGHLALLRSGNRA